MVHGWNLEPQGGFEPANLPITNRLRCHCATGALFKKVGIDLIFDVNSVETCVQSGKTSRSQN